MINNRQNGRRRGRGGGQRPPNSTPNTGNRQDNRQRGNAAQLHEKYKALARDAQLAGDRVQTENFLQYADHYFRVLNEGRARFEEQRRDRDDYGQDGDEDQEEGVNAANDSDDRDERKEREPRFASDRPSGDRGSNDRGNNDRGNSDRVSSDRDGNDRGGNDRAAGDRGGSDRGNGERTFRNGANRDRDDVRPQRSRPPIVAVDEDQDGDDERISLDVLPPAIATEDSEPVRAPRRRTRRPRPDEDAEIAPAA